VELAVEPTVVPVVEFIIELIVKSIALSSNRFKIRLFLFLLTYNTSSDFCACLTIKLVCLILAFWPT